MTDELPPFEELYPDCAFDPEPDDNEPLQDHDDWPIVGDPERLRNRWGGS